MDFQRIILGSTLAVITYMLVLQWNEDYGTKPTTVEHSATVSAYGSTDKTATGDLPATLKAAAETPAKASVAVVDVATNGQLISVKTDVLNVIIDSKGGDIIEVSLPQQKAQLGQDLPFVLLEQNAERTYIAQSGLVGANGPDADKDGRPTYTTSSTDYTLTGETLEVDLNFTKDGVNIIKRFTFSEGKFAVAVNYLIDNQSSQNWQASLFAQIKRGNFGDPTSQTEMGMQSYLGPVFSTVEDNYQKYDFDDIDEANYNKKTLDGWVAMVQHYFVSAWVPAPGAEYTYSTRKSGNNYIAGFVSPTIDVAAGSTADVSATFFAGPKDQAQMEATAPALKLTVDYGWLWWIASPLYWLLTTIHGFLGNWGLAIIGITMTVKAALFHLNAKAFRSMAKMRKFGPVIASLKEKHGEDKQKMSKEMMELYKKEKINPLGGCLPIVAQMPIFIALYWVLMESVELRHASFLYINDLSVQDPYFILPILMGASMFIQQSLNPAPPDPMQAKIMKMLPIIFTFFFLWFPAGLTLYWVVNNVLSIAQQYVINKQIENEPSKK
ncbi:MAG: YidC/Oxa1 family membrane protein insertase [Oceanospirillaceae bacterium]|jgi:YidC/Oxa1 family membrane protein insertase